MAGTQVSEALVDLVVKQVRGHPGITRAAVARSMSGRIATRWAAIEEAVASGRVFEGKGYAAARGGSRRTVAALFPRYAGGPGGESTSGVSIAAKRRAAGLTQKQLADGLGVSRSLVRQWELGLQDVSPASVKRVEAVLGRAPEILEEARRRRDVVDIPPGPELRSMRERAGWTREEVAAHLGRAPGTIQGWERGARVPGEARPPLLELLGAEGPRNVEARKRELLAQVGADPGITFEELTRGGRAPGHQGKSHRRGAGPGGVGRDWLTARCLDELVAAGRLHVASSVRSGRSRPGFHPGQGPALKEASMSGGELGEARRAAGLSKPQLARLLAVSATQVTHWESGAQRIPAARAEQVRAVLAPLEPSAPHADVHRVGGEAMEGAALDGAGRSPGLSKSQLCEQMPGAMARRLKVVDALVDRGALVRATVERPGPRGSTRRVNGLFLPDAAPADAAPVRSGRRSDGEVEESMIAAVRAAPGITRNAALGAPQAVGDRGRRRAAMERLVDAGRLELRKSTSIDGRGVRRTALGLFVPGIPSTVDGRR